MAKSGAKWSKKTTKWMPVLQKGCYNFLKNTIYTVRCFISVDIINYDGTYFPR